jgi:protein dithiol oxidoreductase (disulfide-forming)
MRSPYRALSATWCALALTLALGAGVARSQALVENADYKALTPAQPSPSDKIEVIEFFSYGCPHCAEFFPLVEAWQKGLAKDVTFRRVPVGFNRPQWVNLERAYYALQASGDLAKLDGPLFHAIHQQHLPLFDPQSLSEWVGTSGGNADKFSAAYSSFGVNNQTVQADKLAEDYQVTSIPTMAVAGKYVAQGASFTEILANTDKAIAQARKERAAAKK